MLKYIIVLLLFLLPQLSKSQNISNNDSEYLLGTAIALMENTRFLEAIYHLDQIPPNDPNYVEGLGRKALALTLAQQFDKSIATANYALLFSNGNNYLLYKALANSYFAKGELDRASEVYHLLCEEYPYDTSAHLLLGQSEMKLGKLLGAITAFQNQIELDFSDAKAHFLLGHLLASTDRSAAALLSFGMCVFLAQDTIMLRETIDAMQKVANVSYRNSITPGVNDMEDNVLGNLELAIETKLVNSDKWKPVKPKSQLAQQLYLLCSSFRLQAEPFNFWLRNYAPFFDGVYQNDLFTPFIYEFEAKLGDDKAKKWLEKHTKEKAAFDAFLSKHLTNRQCHIFEKQHGKYGEKQLWFSSKKKVLAIGNASQTTEDSITRQGFWKFVDFNGKVAFQGSFNDGQKDSLWEWYYPNKNVNRRAKYNNGNKVDTIFSYYLNGKIKEKTPYTNNLLEGRYEGFYSFGAKHSIRDFKNNVPDGKYLIFYPNGQIKSDATYAKGLVNGSVYEYYDDATLKSVNNFKDDILHGAVVTYYPMGNIQGRGNYLNGKKTGVWEWFYSSGGTLSFENYNSEGLKVGESKSYYENGKVEESRFFADGKLEGDVLGYSKDGSLLYRYTYKSGQMVSYLNYNLVGELIGQGVASGEELLVETTFPNGVVEAKGKYSNGDKEGLWQFFYSNGKLHRVVQYHKNLKHGEAKEYYADGKPKHVTFYNQDKPEGEFVRYFRNDSIAENGIYESGMRIGKWVKYYPNGKLMAQENYVFDKLEGYQYYFFPDGKLKSQNLYDEGVLMQIDYFDKKEMLMDKHNYKMSDTTFRSFYPSGEPMMVSRVQNRQIHGEFKVFYPNGAIREKGNMQFGKMDGNFVSYFANGNIQETGQYEKGRRIGAWKELTEEGLIRRVCVYKQDNELVEVYDEGGKLAIQQEYRNGYLEGYEKVYSPNGFVLCRKNYKQGVLMSYALPKGKKLFGPEIPVTYTENKVLVNYSNGKVAIEQQYDDGYLTGVAKLYFGNGNLFRETHYKSGEKNGLEKVFYSNGSIRSESHFFNGQLDGTARFYNNKGDLQRSETYLLGLLHGERIHYSKNEHNTALYEYGVLQQK